MNYTNLIIEKIKRNRISSTEVADCLGKSGDIPDVYALNRGQFRVGRVFWVYAWNQSNWDVHEQIRNVQEGDIVYIEPFNCNNRAIIGDLVSKYLLLINKLQQLLFQVN